ncbi:Hly-III-related protein [Penicillium longicatenatum]|uniref:Hly-III-related protein n=1 Tax=Penicillium longicatenatum TaxID=1561947 RepID=UPI0025488D1F|nr:Hly-III-related protein [Penicillium longicatenatum]KAJ5640338.1 Hly-III-related protein [Penicillium longicatenatum]
MTAIHFAILQFPSQSSIQIGYICALVLAAVGYMVDFVDEDYSASLARERFPYQCALLILLSLVPTINTITNTVFTPTPLALQFCRFIACSTLGGVNYLLRPLERLGVIVGWKPSLYAMHLVLAYSAVVYSKSMLDSMSG